MAGGLVVLTLLRYICTVIRVHARGRYGAFNVGLRTGQMVHARGSRGVGGWCRLHLGCFVIAQIYLYSDRMRGRSPKTFSIGFSAGLSPILVKISVNCMNW